MNLKETAQQMLEKAKIDLAQNQVAYNFCEWQVNGEEDEAKKKEKQEESLKLMAQVENIEKSISLFTTYIETL